VEKETDKKGTLGPKKPFKMVELKAKTVKRNILKTDSI